MFSFLTFKKFNLGKDKSNFVTLEFKNQLLINKIGKK